MAKKNIATNNEMNIEQSSEVVQSKVSPSYKETLEYIHVERIKPTPNVRLTINEDYTHIKLNQFDERGLLVPIKVIADVNNPGMYLCEDGRQRLKLCVHTFNNERSLYDKLFPNGIPCHVITGASISDLLRIRCNHSSAKGLTGKCELALTVFEYLKANEAIKREYALKGITKPSDVPNMTEREIVSELYLAFEQNFRPAAEKVHEYRRKLISMDKAEVIEGQKLVLDCFKGSFQNFKRLYSLPDFAFDCWRAKEENRKVSGAPDWWNVEDQSFIPNTGSNDVVKRLESAMQEDSKTLFEGKPLYGKHNPGPAFRLAFLSIVDEMKKEGETTRPKAKSASEMKEIAKELKSDGLKQLMGLMSGDKEVVSAGVNLEQIDTMLNLAEYIQRDKRPLGEVMEIINADMERLTMIEAIAKYGAWLRERAMKEMSEGITEVSE